MYTVALPSKARDVRIDCNRGRGTWKSAGEPDRVRPMAITVPSPPWILHDHIVKQWPHVRSYVIRGGSIALADGRRRHLASSSRQERSLKSVVPNGVHSGHYRFVESGEGRGVDSLQSSRAGHGLRRARAQPLAGGARLPLVDEPRRRRAEPGAGEARAGRHREPPRPAIRRGRCRTHCSTSISPQSPPGRCRPSSGCTAAGFSPATRRQVAQLSEDPRRARLYHGRGRLLARARAASIRRRCGRRTLRSPIWRRTPSGCTSTPSTCSSAGDSAGAQVAAQLANIDQRRRRTPRRSALRRRSSASSCAA